MKIKEVVNFFVDWRLLPIRAQHWLFGTATRGVEVMSVSMLLALLVLFATEHEAVATIPIYRKFAMVPQGFWIWSMTIASIGVGLTMLSNRYIAQVLNGAFLIFSGFILMLVGAAFALAYPPFSPGVVIYPTMALMCTLAGNNKIRLLKEGVI